MSQDKLETVVPKAVNAGLLVVSGRFRGQVGKLLSVSREEGAVAVQLLADLSIQQLMMDDVAQYCGDLEDQ